jgi:hypothetical protein
MVITRTGVAALGSITIKDFEHCKCGIELTDVEPNQSTEQTQVEQKKQTSINVSDRLSNNGCDYSKYWSAQDGFKVDYKREPSLKAARFPLDSLLGFGASDLDLSAAHMQTAALWRALKSKTSFIAPEFVKDALCPRPSAKKRNTNTEIIFICRGEPMCSPMAKPSCHSGLTRIARKAA